jgi:hypothetical protein
MENAKVSMMIKSYEYALESKKPIYEVLEEVANITEEFDNNPPELLFLKSEIKNWKQYEEHLLKQ